MTGERESSTAAQQHSSTAAQQHSSTECSRQPRRAQSAAGKKGVAAGVGAPHAAARRGAGGGGGVGEGVGVGVTPLEGDALRDAGALLCTRAPLECN